MIPRWWQSLIRRCTFFFFVFFFVLLLTEARDQRLRIELGCIGSPGWLVLFCGETKKILKQTDFKRFLFAWPSLAITSSWLSMSKERRGLMWISSFSFFLMPLNFGLDMKVRNWQKLFLQNPTSSNCICSPKRWWWWSNCIETFFFFGLHARNESCGNEKWKEKDNRNVWITMSMEWRMRWNQKVKTFAQSFSHSIHTHTQTDRSLAFWLFFVITWLMTAAAQHFSRYFPKSHLSSTSSSSTSKKIVVAKPSKLCFALCCRAQLSTLAQMGLDQAWKKREPALVLSAQLALRSWRILSRCQAKDRWCDAVERYQAKTVFASICEHLALAVTNRIKLQDGS